MRIVTISEQKEKLFLVFDQGGHATRALVFNELGQIVCRAESEISTIQKGDLVVEHVPEEIVRSVFQVLKDVEVSLGGECSNISAAGLATQRSSFVCWDKNTGRALTPVISWQDRRALNTLVRFKNMEARIHDTTGLYLNPHYGASKMTWCLQHETAVQASLKAKNLCMAPLASYILFHLLAGHPFKVDPANASRTLLMDYKKLAWDKTLLDVFAIPASSLPVIENTRVEYGYLELKNMAIPLLICSGDQSAAIFAEGTPKSSSLYVNVGTGAFVQQYCDQLPALAEEKMLASIVYADALRRAYVIEGTVNGAARALDGLAENNGFRDYQAKLDVWAQAVDEPPVYINGISGVGSPFWKATLNSHFLDDAPLEAQFVGVLESIVFLIYSNVAAIQKLHKKPGKIAIAGGLSNSCALCQKLSDLTQLPVQRAAESEATAKGVYFLLSGIEADTPGQKCQTFNPAENKLLVARYTRWLAVMWQHID
ncbi:MAG TPA: hypothetical protein ENK06_06065 [Gammaproteobacteria bacterium]|nr:hypothetical protein [Gammaproteobacteria bacterium]